MQLRTAFAAVVALLVCAGSAHASSLVYIKDYTVWLANPDGTGQRQLTTDGFKELPYESPSQADDGTSLAGRGLRFSSATASATRSARCLRPFWSASRPTPTRSARSPEALARRTQAPPLDRRSVDVVRLRLEHDQKTRQDGVPPLRWTRVD